MMATGKKLMILTCYASAAAILLLVGISAPAIYDLASSGKPLCVPRLSIRCHESDCGSFFQRCGSNEVLHVPEHKVCYKDALLSASRTDLHSCPSTITPRNSSGSQGRNLGVDACNCNLCTYPQSCQCKCTQGVNVESAVTCENRQYRSLAVALSMGVPAGLCSEAPKRPMWEIMLEALQERFSEFFRGQWSLQDVAAIFTFQPPSITDLNGSCNCYISQTCSRQCTG